VEDFDACVESSADPLWQDIEYWKRIIAEKYPHGCFRTEVKPETDHHELNVARETAKAAEKKGE
jgi:hypothetical protein